MTTVVSNRNKPAKLSRVTMTNCMSWRSGTIELHPGLNVVVGPSDSGKTNVYRAVRAVVENCTASDLLTVGAQSGSVQVEFADALGVSINKGIGKAACNEYTIARAGLAAQTYQKVGADCPQPVADALRLGPVDLSGIEADLHFSAQRGPAFGVDAKPGDLAKMIGAVSGLDVVYRGLAQAESNRKAAQLDADRTEATFIEARDKFRAAEAAFPRAESVKLRDSISKASHEHQDEADRARELFLAGEQCELLLADVARMEKPVADAIKLITAAEAKWAERQAIGGRWRELEVHRARLQAAIDDLEVAESNFKTKTAALDEIEKKVHKIVGTECPLCGRKGKP